MFGCVCFGVFDVCVSVVCGLLLWCVVCCVLLGSLLLDVRCLFFVVSYSLCVVVVCCCWCLSWFLLVAVGYCGLSLLLFVGVCCCFLKL